MRSKIPMTRQKWDQAAEALKAATISLNAAARYLCNTTEVPPDPDELATAITKAEDALQALSPRLANEATDEITRRAAMEPLPRRRAKGRAA